MLISRRAVADYSDRDFDSFQWMKKLQRERILREIANLRVKPKFKTDPWLHQLVCFYIAMCEPRFLFLLDMGLGKSKILADIMTQRQRERKLEGALVTVPRLINIDSWVDDLARHSDLEPWCINVADTEEKWERLAYPKGDVTLIDYQGLHWALCKKVKKKKGLELALDQKRIDHVAKQYNFLGLDESHKLGNHNSLWWGIADRLSKRMDYCYATTGTLFGKNVEAAWSQFHIVDQGETFGENLGLFRKTFFYQKTNGFGVKFVFDNHQERLLNHMLQHRSLQYDESEVNELPARVHRKRLFDMSEEQREHYLRAVEGLIGANGKFAELEAPWIRMRQIVSGYLCFKDDLGDHVLRFKDNPKLRGLESLLDEIGGHKLVIAYDYTETGRMVSEHLTKLKVDHEWFYGGTKDKSASRRRFIEKESCQVFLMNSEAGGTGNNGLQDVCKYLLFFESPSSPTTRKQTIKRIHRPGQEHRSFIYDFISKGSLDKGILEGIEESIDVFDSVVRGVHKEGKKRGLLDLLYGR